MGLTTPKCLRVGLNRWTAISNGNHTGEAQKLRIAKWKLTGDAQLAWEDIERNLREARMEILTWGQMRELLEKKYVPETYRGSLMQELYALRQGPMTIDEYKARFDNLVLRSQIREDPPPGSSNEIPEWTKEGAPT